MKQYCGNRDPFVFLSYGESDRAAAEETAAALDSAARVYAAAQLGRREKSILAKAAALVLLVSEASMAQAQEVAALAAAKGTPIIPVYLDGAEKPAGLRFLLGGTQGIFRTAYETAEAFGRALCASPTLGTLRVTEAQIRAGRRTPILAAAGLLGAVALTLLLILQPFSVNRINPSSTLGQLGLSGNPAAIRSVALYGSELKSDFEDSGVYQAYSTVFGENARLYLPQADELVPYGSLRDLSDFSQLKKLEELALAGNSVSDITPLLSLTKLKKLDLSSQQYNGVPTEELPNAGLTLQGIGALKSLEVLYLNGNNLLDEGDPSCGLSALNELPAFRRLVLDYDELQQLRGVLGEVKYEIVCLGTEVRSYEEYLAAAADPDCHQIVVPHGTTLSFPADSEVSIPAKVMLGGADFTVRNYGTLHVYGWWECGLTSFYNEGTVIVEPEGSFIGGMSSTYNTGLFIVEEGALHSIERGMEFYQQEGSYVNKGTLVFGWGGQFYLNGGSAENDGTLIVEKNERTGGMPMPDNWYENKFATAERFTGNGKIETQLVNIT